MAEVYFLMEKCLKMKNRALEFYRFLFSIVIALYHLRAQIGPNFFESGYIIVDFFFILSGFLLAQSLSRRVDNPLPINAGVETVHFIKKKLMALYPHYLLSLLFCWAISICILKSFTLKEALVNGWTEVLLLQMTGMNINSFTGNSADWYVSSLILALFLCSFLLLRYKKTFSYILAPVIAVNIYVYLYRNIGHLGSIRAYRVNMLVGTMRGIAGICLGCICFCVFCYIYKNFSNTHISKILFTGVDLLCLGLIVIRIFSDWKTSKDFLMLPIFFVLILSVFLKASYLSDVLDNRVSQFLGSISYAIFLNHTVIRDTFKRLSMDPVPRIVLYLTIIIILSIITTKLIRYVTTTRLVTNPLSLIFKPKEKNE